MGSKNTITILKFKRHRTTYTLAVDPAVKNALSFDGLRQSLTQAINSSGGLLLVDEDGENEDIDEDDIVVPKSELMDDAEPANEPVDVKLETEDGSESKLHVTNVTSGQKQVQFDEIELAVPRDKTAPYDNQWIELNSGTDLDTIGFADYDIVAFRCAGEESFSIVEAAYDD